MGSCVAQTMTVAHFARLLPPSPTFVAVSRRAHDLSWTIAGGRSGGIAAEDGRMCGLVCGPDDGGGPHHGLTAALTTTQAVRSTELDLEGSECVVPLPQAGDDEGEGSAARRRERR